MSILITYECTDRIDRHRGRHRSAQNFFLSLSFLSRLHFCSCCVFTYIWNIQMCMYTSSSDVFAHIFDTILFQKAVVCVGLCCKGILLMFVFVCVCFLFQTSCEYYASHLPHIQFAVCIITIRLTS